MKSYSLLTLVKIAVPIHTTGIYFVSDVKTWGLFSLMQYQKYAGDDC